MFESLLVESWWWQVALILAATFVSEDLTCVSVGLLVRDGHLGLGIGLLGCFLGIFAGDLGLWLLGRIVGLGLIRWIPEQRVAKLSAWLDRHGWSAIFAARFLPGTRMPIFIAAGALGRRARHFVLWAAVAAIVWTPLLVLASALLGKVLAGPLSYVFGGGWIALLLSAAVLFILVRVSLLASTATGRGKLMATVSRLWRWEFWPSWLFYLPLLPWLVYLSIRYRGSLKWTAANPGIEHGGVVGESKFAILRKLEGEFVVPSVLVEPGEISERMKTIYETLEQPGWAFPLILKPDAAQRGAGVKKINDLGEVERYLSEQPYAVVVQTYHPGPFEAGIFYYRLPGEEKGHIFSITDKEFPVLVGDGHRTLEELIWQHPRFRMQADTFLTRHAAQADRVLGDGETLRLALAGNHCQGTLFRDGAHLITPELEAAIDAVAQRFDGFFIGRFDVRYSDKEAFCAGRDLAILELNGVTSESTNIYDPSWSLHSAYWILGRQWALLYRIGDENARRGHAPTPVLTLLRDVGEYYRKRRVNPLAD